MFKKTAVLLNVFLLCLTFIACQKRGSEITYPTLPPTLKVGVPLTLEVQTDSSTLEFKWWVKYGNNDWVIVKNWSSDKTFSIVPDKAGSLAVQVDVKERGKDKELEKKWLGQIQVTQ